MDKKVWFIIVVLGIVLLPSVFATPVKVIAPDGSDAANAVVRALNGTTTIASGTTNSTGWVDLSLDNGTTVFVVEYNTTTDAITLVDVNTTQTIYINMSAMYWVKLFSTGVQVNVTVTEPTTETDLEYTTNETTIYTDTTINMTFPTEVGKFPYKYTFKEIDYDGSSTTDPFLALAPTSNVEVTAVYERQWWITLSTEQIVLVIIASASIILLLLAVTRGGAKAFAERQRKYWIKAK